MMVRWFLLVWVIAPLSANAQRDASRQQGQGQYSIRLKTNPDSAAVKRVGARLETRINNRIERTKLLNTEPPRIEVVTRIDTVSALRKPASPDR